MSVSPVGRARVTTAETGQCPVEHRDEGRAPGRDEATQRLRQAVGSRRAHEESQVLIQLLSIICLYRVFSFLLNVFKIV